MNTIDDLGHPLILETAKNLAWKQVGLGFCAPQDQGDLAQDLLLYLCRQFSRYTGTLPLVTWACRLLHGRINAINRRLLGVPSPSQQRRSRSDSATTAPKRPAAAPTPAPEPHNGPWLSASEPNAGPPTPPLTEPPSTETFTPVNQPEPTPAIRLHPETEAQTEAQAEPQKEAGHRFAQNSKPESVGAPPNNRARPAEPPPAGRTWRERLRRLRVAMLSWWLRPP